MRKIYSCATHRALIAMVRNCLPRKIKLKKRERKITARNSSLLLVGSSNTSTAKVLPSMSNQSYSHSTKTLQSVTQFLHHSCQTRNLGAIKELHALLLRKGFLFLCLDSATKIIFSYTTCHDKDNLKTLTNCLKFLNPQNPFPFNVLISDFCRNGFAFSALKTVSFMHINRVPLDTYALCSSLIASSSIQNFHFGKQIHAHVAKSGWLSSVFVGSALVVLYRKLSFIDAAAKMFDEMPVKNTVCSNALLSAYGDAGLWSQGLEFIRKMPSVNLDYDNFTLSAMLRACAGLSAIGLGREVHAFVTRKICNLQNDVFLQSSLIEMYGKCGFVGNALQVFNLAGLGVKGERNRDIVLWTSMLGVYGRNGAHDEVIGLYKKMLEEGVKPDGVAFLTVISACRHTGQVNLGIEYFESMNRDFKLNPGPEHYSCVVDLLCRAGELNKAWELVNEMLSKGYQSPSASMWGALLSACEERSNIELGKLAAERALELEPKNVGIYVMLSNLYAKFGLWDEISTLRELMKDRGFKKDVACSWIEVTN